MTENSTEQILDDQRRQRDEFIKGHLLRLRIMSGKMFYLISYTRTTHPYLNEVSI